ncbi:hypothetical protein MARI_01550 [Marinobacter sp. JH2]|nr:hypothetical protein MARI_01550 [Marinobacter sp. JH2]
MSLFEPDNYDQDAMVVGGFREVWWSASYLLHPIGKW